MMQNLLRRKLQNIFPAAANGHAGNNKNANKIMIRKRVKMNVCERKSGA